MAASNRTDSNGTALLPREVDGPRNHSGEPALVDRPDWNDLTSDSRVELTKLGPFPEDTLAVPPGPLLPSVWIRGHPLCEGLGSFFKSNDFARDFAIEHVTNTLVQSVDFLQVAKVTLNNHALAIEQVPAGGPTGKIWEEPADFFPLLPSKASLSDSDEVVAMDDDPIPVQMSPDFVRGRSLAGSRRTGNDDQTDDHLRSTQAAGYLIDPWVADGSTFPESSSGFYHWSASLHKSTLETVQTGVGSTEVPTLGLKFW